MLILTSEFVFDRPLQLSLMFVGEAKKVLHPGGLWPYEQSRPERPTKEKHSSLLQTFIKLQK